MMHDTGNGKNLIICTTCTTKHHTLLEFALTFCLGSLLKGATITSGCSSSGMGDRYSIQK
ncbi:hypothetical protein EON63_10120 [archaeon]|nr:MAG: hypothetical protein EON63_10120 [archaeon]